MTTKKLAIITVLLITAGVAAYFIVASLQTNTPPANKQAQNTTETSKDDTGDAASEDNTPKVAYVGREIAVTDKFTVKIPNGWRASVSTAPSFLGIQFARPSKLETLVYDANKQPVVDYDGIPAWNGLTEHFYIRAMTNTSQNFNPASHAEVTSEKFTFEDGTTGQKYLVTKHATEARKWGGLLKDDVWYGRVYVHEKDGTRTEAHLAYYPSTKIDESFFDKVAKTIR